MSGFVCFLIKLCLPEHSQWIFCFSNDICWSHFYDMPQRQSLPLDWRMRARITALCRPSILSPNPLELMSLQQFGLWFDFIIQSFVHVTMCAGTLLKLKSNNNIMFFWFVCVWEYVCACVCGLSRLYSWSFTSHVNPVKLSSITESHVLYGSLCLCASLCMCLEKSSTSGLNKICTPEK